jgi:hypothetical protein
MFGLFKKDPVKKLEKQYYAMLEKARDIQRSGDIKAYSKIMADSEELWKQIEALKEEQGK